MNKIKKVVASVIFMMISLTAVTYAESEVTINDPPMQEIQITDEFLNENKDLIVEAVDTAFSSGTEFDSEIRGVLSQRFDDIKGSGTLSQTEQDVLYDVLWNIGNQKKLEKPEYKILNMYIQSKSEQQESIGTESQSDGTGIGSTIAIVTLVVLLLGVSAVYALDKLIFDFGGKRKSKKKLVRREDVKEDTELYSTYIRLKGEYSLLKKEFALAKAENEKLEKLYQNLDEECGVLYEEKEKLRNENSRLSLNNANLQETLLNTNRQVGIEQKESTVSEPEREILKKSLIIEDGYIKIIEGDYVEVVYVEDIVQAVPTQRVLKASVRRSLSNFFDFIGNGENNIRVDEPCVLKKDMQGYYKVVNKGTVYLS